MIVSRAEAAERGRAFLEDEEGFREVRPRVWVGMRESSFGPLQLEIELPAAFPDEVPDVRYSSHNGLLPHVERDGKVCTADSTGILVDARRPHDVIREALDRAVNTLEKSIRGESDSDLDAEFIAYWQRGDRILRAYSICSVDERARMIAVGTLLGEQPHFSGAIILADSEDAGRAWAEHLGLSVVWGGRGIYAPLSRSIRPPAYSDKVSPRWIANTINANGNGPARSAFQKWIKTAKWPTVALLSTPGSSGERIAFGARLPKELDNDKAAAGFRRGKLPPQIAFLRSGASAIDRLAVNRLDPVALLRRGGSDAGLSGRTACVIGCGALGSRWAAMLAQAGMNLRLIDKDVLLPENVHRHELGMGSCGYNKAVALTVELCRRFPHLQIAAAEGDALAVLEANPTWMESDVFCVATGDEALELRLSERLPRDGRVVHSWVEPLGIGGHVFAAGTGACFGCLFAVDPDHGLHNQAAFAAPGQRFVQTEEGCGGGFIPFSSESAVKTALLASRVVTTRVRGSAPAAAALYSWRGDEGAFTALHALSARGLRLDAGEHEHPVETQPDCPHRALHVGVRAA